MNYLRLHYSNTPPERIINVLDWNMEMHALVVVLSKQKSRYSIIFLPITLVPPQPQFNLNIHRYQFFKIKDAMLRLYNSMLAHEETSELPECKNLLCTCIQHSTVKEIFPCNCRQVWRMVLLVLTTHDYKAKLTAECD